MSIFRALTFVVSMAVLFAFSGCQGDNSDTVEYGNYAEMTVILPVTTKEVTLNSEAVNIEVKVIDENNNLFTSGEIKVIYPDDVRQGRDIGYFEEDTVAVEKGVANFVYYAPSNISTDTSDIVFQFYHDSDPTVSQKYTIIIRPEVGQNILDSYSLNTNIGTNVDMGLESNKLVSFYVENDKGELLLDSDIVSIIITSLSPSVGTLEDTLGNAGTSLTANNKNNVTVNVKSNTDSGIIPLKVEVNFKDSNGDAQSMTEVFNVLVLSGPPSAISLSYVATEQIADRAKFVEKWALTVTDKYGNLVDSNPALSMGMIAGFANDSSNRADNDSNFLYFPSGADGGKISKVYDSFTVTKDVFDDVDLANDTLVTFGDGYTYNASGKWDISSVSSKVLGLKDDYDSTTTSNMGFAVGHNYRQDTCRDAIEWVANVYPKDNNYIVDDTGTAIINIEYDYYLTGKSTVLWVNLVGKDYATDETIRIGEAKKINLRGQGLTAAEYSFAKGFMGLIQLDVSITNTVEWYRNANFGYGVEVSGDGTAWFVREDSNGNTTSCVNNGVGYVLVEILSPAEEAGTVKLTGLLPSSEF